MDQVDAGNPYRAPEAPISALRAEIRCPPVYSAISMLCWAVGAFHLAGCLILIGIAIRNGLELGWDHAFGPGNSLVGPLILGLGLLGTVAYLTAGRWLRDNRGRVGLILCVAGVALTYLIIWLGGRS